MKRLKALVSCCIAAALATVALAGCSSQESYTPPEKAPSLSTPVIGKEGTLRVGMNTDNAPFSAQPQGSSKIVGIDVDIAAALADSMGLKLEIVDVGSDPESALSAGKADVVLGVKKADANTTFWKSDTYLQTSVALFAASSSVPVPDKASAPSIAAQISSTSSWAVTNEFDTVTLKSTTDLKSAFAALASGEVQYAAADAIIGTYAARNAGDETAIVALMQQPSGYCMGVLDSNTDLKQAISEAVATLTGNGTVAVIEKKWLGTALDLSAIPLTAGAKTAGSSTADNQSATQTGASTESGSQAGGNAVRVEDIAA